MTAAQRADAGGHDLWHYAVGSERKGPVPRTTIAKLLASGEISAETYVWQPGMDNWVHLVDAPALKPLVAGLEGDGQPEEFVEEDTAFTSPADLKAVHTALADADDDDEELSGDTIVEALPEAQIAAAGVELGPRGTIRTVKKDRPQSEPAAHKPSPVAAPAKAEPVSKSATPTGTMGAVKVPAPAPVKAPAPAPVKAPAPAPVSASHARPAPKPDSGLFSNVASSTMGSASASGADVFASSGAVEDDIFGSSALTSEAEDIAGVHGRRQSSVLFSLDELGREEGKKGGGKSGGNEQFVTDSSGLIDIKAIATNERRSVLDDPFGASAPNLVLSQRGGGPTAMTIPIVERTRGNGPWILAAAALLLVGGGIVAFIVSGNNDPAPTPPVLASRAPDKAEPEKTEPAKTEAAKTEPAKTPGEPIKTAEATKEPVVATPPTSPTNPEGVAKVEPGTPSNPNPTVIADPATPGSNPVVAKVEDKPKTEVKREDKPKEDKPKEDKPKEERVVVAPPTNPGNTDKVNDLLSKLNSGDKTDKKDDKTSDSALPDKLSAATVRNTIKGRFGRCGGMISNPSGSVTVQTQFVISSSGVVQSARVSDGGGTSPDVQRCVVSVIKETTFGKFKEPTMQVNLPVRLL